MRDDFRVYFLNLRIAVHLEDLMDICGGGSSRPALFDRYGASRLDAPLEPLFGDWNMAGDFEEFYVQMTQ